MTFDIIADLCFGEPFGGLQDKATHKYIQLLFRLLKSLIAHYIMSHWPLTKYLKSLVADQSAVQSRKDFYRWIADHTQQRTDRETQRADFMTEILAHSNGDKGGARLSSAEINANMSIFVLAGSETTATLLSGATYLLCMKPTVLQKLQAEIRSRWKTYADITLDDASNAPYLLAVLQEALRYFPPVPTGFERRVPQGGAVLSGFFVPKGTALCVSQYPANHSARNFKDPDTFVPERWMGDPKYAGDKRSVVQPFSFGPRNCLGRNLAHAEMRLMLAKMVHTFDMQLDAASEKWMDECKVYTIWAKPPLMVKLTEVER